MEPLKHISCICCFKVVINGSYVACVFLLGRNTVQVAATSWLIYYRFKKQNAALRGAGPIVGLCLLVQAGQQKTGGIGESVCSLPFTSWVKG